MARPRDSKIVLAGRAFDAAGPSTIQQDHWMMTRVREAGLLLVEREPDEDPQAYGERMLDALLRSEQGLELLGGLLVPVGQRRWTPEVALETAAFIGDLSAPEDKARVGALLASLLIPFLMRALASSTSSARPSGAAPDAPAPRPESARSMASGAASSGFSPGMN